MRKIIAIACAMLLIGFSGCEAGTTKSIDATNTKKYKLLDKAGITAYFIGIDPKEGGIDIKFSAQNKTDSKVTLEIQDITINGITFDEQPMMALVKPNSKAEGSLPIPKSKLGEYGITNVSSVEFSFGAVSASGELLIKSEQFKAITSKLDEPAPAIVAKEAIFSQYGVNISFIGFFNKEDSISARFYISNDRSGAIFVYSQDESANGYMAKSGLSAKIEPGKGTVKDLAFSDKDLEHIGYIREIELSFVIEDSGANDIIYRTTPMAFMNDEFSAKLESSNIGEKKPEKAAPKAKALFSKQQAKLTAVSFIEGNIAYQVEALLENDSSESITVECNKAVINGKEVEASYLSKVQPGKKSYNSIQILKSDLINAGIDGLNAITLNFEVYDSGSLLIYEINSPVLAKLEFLHE